jgi:hypothetical protein
MVARNLPLEHQFVCLTNTKVPVDSIPLKHNWPGYWSKIELFRPGIFTGRVLFLDLDVLVLDDLTTIVNYPSRFVMSATTGNPKMKEGKHILHIHSSSLMAWDAGAVDYLYTDFVKSPIKYMRYYFGDQDYISDMAKEADEYPLAWAKKLRDCPNFSPTKGMKVAYCMLGKNFPGKNDAVVKLLPWAKEVWQ